MDVHNTTRRLEWASKVIEKDPKISEHNKQLILKFKDRVSSLSLSSQRVLFYVTRLIVIARAFPKSFEEATREDVEKLVAEIEEGNFQFTRKFKNKDYTRSGKYTSWTKHDYKVTLKKFFQWLRKREWDSREYPKEVKWIRTTLKNNRKKLPEDILTKDEIRSLIQATSNPRDKAFISVLYESGCRIGEILNIKIKDITFDEYGAKVIIPEGKTGPRRIRLISSIPHVETWLGYHPHKKDPEAFLWTTYANSNKGNIISYEAISKMLRQTAKRAGITKKVNPHNFRHSRATHLASELTSPIQCAMFGWVQGSDAPATYIHLNGKDLDKALLKINGKLPPEEDNNIKCPRCNDVNHEISRFCKNCGLPFEIKDYVNLEDERKKYDDKMSKVMEVLLQNPHLKKEIVEALKGVSNS
jgi:integrase/recombinase XerD